MPTSKVVGREPFDLVEPFIEHQGEPRSWWLRKQREIGRRILLARKGATVPVVSGARIPIFLDPGKAFGTGGHGTTKGCLIALEKTIRGGESVLDVGTGTGILAVAARKLGAARVVAVDIDRTACREAREHLALNGVADGVFVVCGGADSVGGEFDIVVANVRLGALLGFFDDLLPRVGRPGVAILSGLLERESVSFLRFLEGRGLRTRETIGIHGWTTLILDKSR